MKAKNNKGLAIVLLIFFVVAAIVYVITTNSNEATSNSVGTVLINEVMSSNSGAVPDDIGNYSDWVELYNASDEVINLTSWGLSDNSNEVGWAFPSVQLEPHAYLLVYCSGTTATGDALHANFKIKASKDSLILTDAQGRVVDALDVVDIPKNNSFGRQLDNISTWEVFDLPTPGFENSSAGRQAYETSLDASSLYDIVINEVQPNNKTTLTDEFGAFSDWIELYNPSDKDLDISNFGLSDDRNAALKWQFPEKSIVKAHDYLLIFIGQSLDADDEAKTLYPHADFGLNSYKESVVLSSPQGQLIDAIDYEGIPADSTYARNPETGKWELSVKPSPGFKNDDEGFESYQAQYDAVKKGQGLYISEIMMKNYSFVQDADEQYYDWIEIHNPTAQSIDISGYGITNRSGNPNKWRFPEDSVIQPNEYKVLLASGYNESQQVDAAKKKSNYLNVNFKLSNKDGEVLTLWDAQDNLVDRINASTLRYETSFGRDINHVDHYYSTPTPGAANKQGQKGYALSPGFDVQAGLYSGAQTITILQHAESGTEEGHLEIRYTLDGSEPTENSDLYSAPIKITQTTVLRARTFKTGFLPSKTTTASYFINSPHENTLSIVSLSTDPKNFFDEISGIYVPGSNVTPGLNSETAAQDGSYVNANYWQEWERPVHFEIFGENGEFEFGEDAAIRIFGAFSRIRQQKGLALIARSEYGASSFDYSIFKNRPYNSYKSIILRASGQDSTVTKVKDIVATSLVDGTTHLKVQAYRQAVVYLNGEYFGIFNIREKVTKYWIAANYDIKDPENIDLIRGNSEVLAGDLVNYQALMDYCRAHDLSEDEHYRYIEQRIDIENYIDYLVSEMYIANTDTGNIKFFRERSNDPEKSKWRWIYYDFCWSLANSRFNSVEYLTNPDGHGVGKAFSTQLTRSLLQNDEFKDKFLKRFAELLNTIYSTENVQRVLDECAARIEAEKPRDSEKWPEGGPFNGWKANVKNSRDFAENRPGRIITMLQNYFKLSDQETLELFGRSGTSLE